MFFYFYDTFVNDKKNEDKLTKAENRLIELGINGRIEKLSVLKNAKEMIEDGIKQGAHTVVAVGSDDTLTKVINIVADKKDVIVGYIPMVANSKFANILGIQDSLEACNILSKRLVKKINLGKANQNYFVASISMPETDNLKIECDTKYKVSLNNKHSKLFVYNLGSFLIDKDEAQWKLFPTKTSDLYVSVLPQDIKKLGGILTKKNIEKTSVFPAKKIKITSEHKSVPVILDEQTTLKTPVTITMRPKKVTLIAGRDRRI